MLQRVTGGGVLLDGRVTACYWRGVLQRVTGGACYSVLLARRVTGWRGGAGGVLPDGETVQGAPLQTAGVPPSPRFR